MSKYEPGPLPDLPAPDGLILVSTGGYGSSAVDAFRPDKLAAYARAQASAARLVSNVFVCGLCPRRRTCARHFPPTCMMLLTP